MKLKLDENMHATLLPRFAAEGYDACSVHMQGLSGFEDSDVWAACLKESRTLVTQDQDFADVLTYPVADTHGIIVLRGPNTRLTMQHLLVQTLLLRLRQESPLGRLWIVEPGRVRIHEP